MPFTAKSLDSVIQCGHKHKTEFAARTCGVVKFGGSMQKPQCLIVERAARPKPKSRATRLGEAADNYSIAVDLAQRMRDDLSPFIDDEEETFDFAGYDKEFGFFELGQELFKIDEAIGNANAEVESLQEEITSWKDNIEEKFSSTQKYADLEECESALETVHDAGDEAANAVILLPEVIDATTCNYETISKLIESFDEIERSAQNAQDECESVNFPGMF